MCIDVDMFGSLLSWDALVYAMASVAGLTAIVRTRALPPVTGTRATVAVVIPARDEEHNIAAVVRSIAPLLRDGDEVVVVDDHSSDATAARALDAGARVVPTPTLEPGWMGKPFACWTGARNTSAEVLLFVDADVRIVGSTVVDRLVMLVEADSEALVSVQPWHEPGGPLERGAALFNVMSVIGSGAGGFGTRGSGALAFGPVLACRRDVYERHGGHAHESVRESVIEDIALGRLFDTTDVYVGTRESVTFRMYPGGFRSMVNGFAKNMAAGLGAAGVVPATVAALWMAAIVGALFVSPALYLCSVVQVAWVQRRVGGFGVFSAFLYPLSAVLFVAVLARSLLLASGVGRVSWAGRRLP
jgi:4,4'-diaponeurosporenoate glycosyltransferase